jgi:hypothetical protein
MMQLIAAMGHIDASDHLAVRLGTGLDVHHRQCVRPVPCRVE